MAISRHIGYLARLFGLLSLASAVLLASDAPYRRDPPTVLYLGARTPQSDRSYAAFAAAMDRLPAHRRAAHRLAYAVIADIDTAAIERDVASVLAVPPAVVIAPTADSARAAVRQAQTCAIVFASYPDPVRAGIVASLHQPGGRATGVSLADELHAKRLELLRDAFPSARRVGVLVDRSWMLSNDLESNLFGPARMAGLELKLFEAESAADVDRLFSTVATAGMDAWYIPPTYVAYLAERELIAHLARLGRPAMHSTAEEVSRGALMAYSQDTSFVYDAMADLTARVLTGAPPGSLPVQRPMRFVLSLRPRDEPPSTRIDPSVIRRADRVY